MTPTRGSESSGAAQGRLSGAQPVAMVDIGSNSVRLVVYERHIRALTVLYNEKATSSLARGLTATGRLSEVSMTSALGALRRFRAVCDLMEVGELHAVATSATREASNGPVFVAAAEKELGKRISVLSGAEEAHYAALGAVAGAPGFTGVVGDFGGGSLELMAVNPAGPETLGETYPLGGLRLQDDSSMSSTKAAALARTLLKRSKVLRAAKAQPGGLFCAVGGNWRALATLHQTINRYPLHIVHGYSVSATDLLALCKDLISAGSGKNHVPLLRSVNSTRRELVPYAAAVMAAILERGAFQSVLFSAQGIREGYLYGQLPEPDQHVDPLLQATEELALLRSRAPEFASELCEGSRAFLQAVGAPEAAGDARLREAACNLSDIGWRAHPEYQGHQSIDMVAYADMVGLDHAGRAFLALVTSVRYLGLKRRAADKPLATLAGPHLSQRARLLGAYLRVAYALAGAMPGVLPAASFSLSGKTLQLHLPLELGHLACERVNERLQQLTVEVGFRRSRVLVGER